MPDAHVFRGSVSAVRHLVLDDEDRWWKTLGHFREKRIVVTIAAESEHRSLSANAYLWGPVYGELMNFTGHTKEEIHHAMKCKILGVIETPLGPMPKRGTHDMDSVEFSDFVMRVKVEAADLGCLLPDQEDV